MAISSNEPLFSLLGTTYGGDGRTTFGLPDLRGRTPLHVGRGPGLTERRWGQKGGAERVALTSATMPQHTHAVELSASSAPAVSDAPAGHTLARSMAEIYGPPAALSSMDASMVETTSAGSGTAHENMPPFLVLNYCICLVGLFPSRS